MSKINLHNYEAFLIDYLDGNLNEASIIELKAFVLANPQLEIDLADLDLPSISNDDIETDFKTELKRSEFFVEDEELINYLENNLPGAERKAFELNVLNNKDLALKLEAYKKTILNSNASIAFADKAALYKTADEVILNNIVLAFIEDQLNTPDKLNFEKELKTDTALQKELLSFQKTKLQADDTIVFENKEALKKETKIIALFSFRAVASMAAAILLLIGLAFVFNYYNSQPITKLKEIAKNNTTKNINKTESQTIKAIDTSNQLNSQDDLIAKNSNTKSKKSSIKKDTDHELHKQETNPVAVNKKEEKENEPVVNEEPNDRSKTVIANNQSIEDTSHVTLANSNLSQSNYSKQTSLIAVEENDNDDDAPAAPAKKSFWQRAVKVAKQVNKLGIKAIDGEESQGKNYALSFNSFSVEKR